MRVRNCAAASLFCFIFAVPLIAQEQDCSKQQSTVEQSDCLEKQLQNAEAKERAIYRQIISSLANPLADPIQRQDLMSLPKFDRENELMWYRRIRLRLRDSEQKWLAYRNSTCEAEFATFENGTVGPLVHLGCKRDLTEQRTKWLQESFESYLPSEPDYSSKTPSDH